MITDMTIGAPSKVLRKYALPMLLSVAFQQFYNITDSIIAGRCIGEDALASVGASYPITMIFIAVATGMTSGCSVVISQYFGAKDYKSVKSAVTTSLISATCLSLALTLFGVIFCSPMMSALNTPLNIFDDSSAYLRIYIFGIIGLFLYNTCNACFTALGDSKTPLMFLIASSLGNIALDLVFVVALNMGVRGVAWATLIAQGVSAVSALVALARRMKTIKAQKSKLFSQAIFLKILRVAVPSILQQSFVSVGNLFVQSLVNSYGSSVIAGYSSAIKLNTFAVVTMSTLSGGLSNFTAQNIGANQIERIKQGYKVAMKMAVSASLAFTIAYTLFGSFFVNLFLDSADGVGAISTGVEFLKIVSPFYAIICLKLLGDGVLRGSGVMLQFMCSTFCDLVLRVVLAYVLSGAMGSERGIWLSWPVGWVLSMVLSTFFYLKGDWKTRGRI